MRNANIQKASQDEQQNQTTITTNINFIKKLCPFLKIKLDNKVKLASDKIETKQKTYNLPEKIWDQSIISLGNN